MKNFKYGAMKFLENVAPFYFIKDTGGLLSAGKKLYTGKKRVCKVDMKKRGHENNVSAKNQKKTTFLNSNHFSVVGQYGKKDFLHTKNSYESKI